MTPRGGRWADLRVRVTSAVVMIAVGAVATWEGGWFFVSATVVAFAAMTWELAGMTARDDGVRLILAVSAALCLLASLRLSPPLAVAVLLIPALGFYLTERGDRVVLTLYQAALMLAGAGFMLLRHQGALVFLWLIVVVVVSDIMGYFAGRLIGGPKFWPQISPKKTWAGTVAGWVGATLVGWGFVAAGAAGWGLLIFSPLVAFAGQMGDIVESWIKRRAGVKDASGLIPGHGGVLDRFDALMGAVMAVLVIAQVIPLPFPLAG